MSGIRTTIKAEGVLLRAGSGIRLPLGSAIRNLASSEREAAGYLALDELWQDGQLEEVEPGGWIVPYDRLLAIEPSTARILALPSPDPSLQAQVRSTGVITNTDFRLRLEIRHREHGRLDPDSRSGPAFVLDGGICLLLTPELWRLAAAVADAPPAEADVADRSEHVARVVEAAQKAGASLDDYLLDNNFAVIQELQVDAFEDGEEIRLAVSSNGLGNSDLVLPNGRAVPFARRADPDGQIRRVIVPKSAREKIEAVSRRSRLSGAEIPEFLLNPEAFLPEGLDLSSFSERVRGFKARVYNSRPYLHVKKKPRGWLDFDGGVRLEPTTGPDDAPGPSISVDDYKGIVDRARKTGERFVKHGDDWVEVDVDQADQFLSTVGQLAEHRSRGNRLTAKVVLDVIPNVEILEFEVDLPDATREERPWVDLLPDIEPSKSFHGSLDDHQLRGFRWLSYLHDLGAGGLLADEMGVGKTAQVLALLAKLHDERRLRPALLVLPKTLIENWLDELAKFTPVIDRIHIHTGPQRARSGEYLAQMNVVLTTYDTARQDQVMLAAVDWQVVVADEAQFVKNPTAARTSVVKALKTRQALALTGTPVENGLIEFWCIMDYVQPGLLKSWADFRTEFERPLIDARDEETRRGLVDALLARLDPHYLRRLKEEVLSSLPQKRVEDLAGVALSPLQEARYREILDEAKARGREAVLGAITRLLMTCSHPRASVADWDDQSGDTLIKECPKLEKTTDILESIRSRDEKALIFTEWKSTQKIIQRAIWSRFGISAEIVNGDLTFRRQEVIDQFRKQPGFGVLILNPGVAGYGINIVEANHVIHYTRPWNPAKENQATDRVHRRGQQKPVTIYYPTVSGTVEDKLAQLLADKAQLARDVLRPTRERTVTVDDLVEAIELQRPGIGA